MEVFFISKSTRSYYTKISVLFTVTLCTVKTDYYYYSTTFSRESEKPKRQSNEERKKTNVSTTNISMSGPKKRKEMGPKIEERKICKAPSFLLFIIIITQLPLLLPTYAPRRKETVLNQLQKSKIVVTNL